MCVDAQLSASPTFLHVVHVIVPALPRRQWRTQQPGRASNPTSKANCHHKVSRMTVHNGTATTTQQQVTCLGAIMDSQSALVRGSKPMVPTLHTPSATPATFSAIHIILGARVSISVPSNCAQTGQPQHNRVKQHSGGVRTRAMLLSALQHSVSDSE